MADKSLTPCPACLEPAEFVDITTASGAIRLVSCACGADFGWSPSDWVLRPPPVRDRERILPEFAD